MVCRGVDDGVVVRVEHVSKKYCKSLKHSMFYGLGDIGRNLLGWSSCSGRLRSREFWAVDDVSFELRRGETLGLIGPNGSGKSTLLKMLNGIFWPDRGRISVRGRVGALIEVGAGFHPLLTGRDNVYVNGAILGMNKKQVDEKFDDIVKFADVGEFIDAPVKTYSSGMFVRLGFAVAVHCEPDILLVDEVLAVGDLSFQAKCRTKISEIKKNAGVILVSHSMALVQHVCDRCISIDDHKIMYQGNVSDAVSAYYESMSQIKFNASRDPSLTQTNDRGVLLKTIDVLKNGEKTVNLLSGDPVEIIIKFVCKKVIHNPQVTLTFTGDTYSGFSTKCDSLNVDDFFGQTAVSLKIDYLGLGPGIYSLSLGIWASDMLTNYYWASDVAWVTIKSSKKYVGRFEFKHNWSFSSQLLQQECLSAFSQQKLS